VEYCDRRRSVGCTSRVHQFGVGLAIMWSSETKMPQRPALVSLLSTRTEENGHEPEDLPRQSFVIFEMRGTALCISDARCPRLD
jgi:hypothetical protein